MVMASVASPQAVTTAVASHLILGKEGEEQAAQYLRTQGMPILGRNIRIARDEIDILAFDPLDEVLVFAEVKTRKKSQPDFPALLGATAKKRARLHRAAHAWVNAHCYAGGFRVDLVCVEGGKIVLHVKELPVE